MHERKAILFVSGILVLIGEHCHGIIGQQTEDLGEVLVFAIKRAGGTTFSNMAVRIWYMVTDAEKGFIMPGKVHGYRCREGVHRARQGAWFVGLVYGVGIFRWTNCCAAVMVLFGIGYKTMKVGPGVAPLTCTQTCGSCQHYLVFVVVVLWRWLLRLKSSRRRRIWYMVTDAEERVHCARQGTWW